MCSVAQAELQAVLQRTESERLESEQKLQHQAEMLDARTVRIRRLEGKI